MKSRQTLEFMLKHQEALMAGYIQMTYRKRSGIMLCYPYSEKRLGTWKPPYIVQPKLNGERCRVIKHGPRALLLSSTEEIIASVPHINEAVVHLLPDGEWDGELYVHGWTQSEIHGVVSRTKNIHPRSGEMELHLFDSIEEEEGQLPRIIKVFKLQLKWPLFYTGHKVVWTHQELIKCYDQYIAEGYEGFVVRHIEPYYIRRRSIYVMKFKPKKTDQYLITGLEEAISLEGNPKGMVGAFVCIDDMGTKFKVGAGKLSHVERIDKWKNREEIIGKRLKIEYQTLSDKNKVPNFSRAVEIVE